MSHREDLEIIFYEHMLVLNKMNLRIVVSQKNGRHYYSHYHFFMLYYWKGENMALLDGIYHMHLLRLIWKYQSFSLKCFWISIVIYHGMLYII